MVAEERESEKKQQEEENRRAAAEQQKEESRIAAMKKEERKERRKQKRKAIREMKTSEHKRAQAELKTLMEEEKEARAERKQLRAYFKQRAETAAADATRMEIPLEKMEQLTKNAEAVKKRNDKWYRENAKDNRRQHNGTSVNKPAIKVMSPSSMAGSITRYLQHLST